MTDLPGTPEVAGADIVAGLRQLGLSAGDGVIVHSSLKSVGHVAGGAPTVIATLQEVLTPVGTLVLPTFNQGRAFRDGAEGFFDPRTTAVSTGLIAQTFWQLPDVPRSLNPTHAFAAWGRNAERYIRYHHRTLTVGPDSPLGLLGREGGYGLLLGVDYRANTFHHVVEVTTGAPCLGLRTCALPVCLPDGRMVMGRTWSWRERPCPIDDAARYAPIMAERGLQRQTTIGAATATLFRLSDCFAVIAELLANGLGEFPPCRRCPIRPGVNRHTVVSDWDDQRQCLKPDAEAWTY